MTQLLVSVRSVAEAELALAAGVPHLDIKEPRRGALGRADQRVIADIVRVVGSRASISVALGELLLAPAQVTPSLLVGCQDAKMGLGGCRGRMDWLLLWQQLQQRLPQGTDLVAVVYADEFAEAPGFEVVLPLTQSLGCRKLLIDTYEKGEGNLLAHWPAKQLQQAIHRAQAAGFQVAVGGGLQFEDLPEVLAMGPDIIAVRTGVCETAREGGLSAAKVSRWLTACQQGRMPRPALSH